MNDFHKLRTEQRNPATTHIDRAGTAEMLRMMQEANRRSVEAVGEALDAVGAAVDAAAEALARGGRILYVGAGTSGRLAVQDAAECPPTFGVDPGTVTALIAGGPGAVFRAVEQVEDSAEAGRADLAALNPSPADFVVGVSASGNAPYVAAALACARGRGCRTAAIASNRACRLADVADIFIFTDTGPEVITGSTRLKAGNAQKMVLNMISTGAMVKTGKVYENLMVNLRPTNAKLRRRMVGIVRDIAGVGEEAALAALEANGFVIRDAVAALEKDRPPQ